jgi:transcriptional regulator with GAF, ATPase, and Fis domain
MTVRLAQVKQASGANPAQVFANRSMTMSSNVSFPYDGRGVVPFDRFVRKVDVPDSGSPFDAQAAIPIGLPQDDNPTEGGGRNHGEFAGIIGASSGLRFVFEQARRVAPTSSTVLIEGETGVGKELIARAIHDLSPRRDRSFVKLNCAAIPSGLLESELFGHEKGAFTGAIARKVGRFDLADKGTMFLDEVGDISLELQVKLLRVLQEQEFERLGGIHTQKVNVRLVAATNRDLVRMVLEKQFRIDLYYRLNVFPIRVPPLRQRREDIPRLVRAFVGHCARRMNKQIDLVPGEVMAALIRHDWPGNIRELQNFIERAVILSRETMLVAPVEELKPSVGLATAGAITLEQAESNHILHTLRETNWVIGGPKGAAARLGLKRTTLISKMRRLRLSRPLSEMTEYPVC